MDIMQNSAASHLRGDDRKKHHTRAHTHLFPPGLVRATLETHENGNNNNNKKAPLSSAARLKNAVLGGHSRGKKADQKWKNVGVEKV